MMRSISSKIRRRRSLCSPEVLMLPQATARACPPIASTMPKPVTCEPGSIPRMRTAPFTALDLGTKGEACPAALCRFLQQRVGDVGVRIDVLHVVELLEHVEELQQRLGLRAFYPHLRRRAHRDLGPLELEPRALHRLVHALVVLGGRQHVDRAVFVRDDVGRAGLDRDLHDPVLGGARGIRELADLREQICDGAVRAEVAAVLRERVTDVRDRAVSVVGEAIDHDGDAARAIAFVARLLVALAFELARPALDRALHVVLGHALRLRLLDRETKPRIRRGITASGAGRDRDLADELREDLAALCVLRAFSESDVRPLAVTRHVTAPSVPLRWLLQSGYPATLAPTIARRPAARSSLPPRMLELRKPTGEASRLCRRLS